MEHRSNQATAVRFIQAIQTTFPPHRLQSECCELDGWSWTEGFQRRVKAVACSTLAGICITLTQPAWSAGKNIIEMPKLSWRMALSMASEAVAVCQDRGISVTATVIDSAGLRQAVVKGDSVGPHSLSLSYRKAFTAFAVADALEVNTTSEILKTGKMNAGSPALNTDPDLIFLAGGVAIHGHGKTLLGAIGVSGAPSGLTDEGCAAAALAKYQSEID